MSSNFAFPSFFFLTTTVMLLVFACAIDESSAAPLPLTTPFSSVKAAEDYLDKNGQFWIEFMIQNHQETNQKIANLLATNATVGFIDGRLGNAATNEYMFSVSFIPQKGFQHLHALAFARYLRGKLQQSQTIEGLPKPNMDHTSITPNFTAEQLTQAKQTRFTIVKNEILQPYSYTFQVVFKI